MPVTIKNIDTCIVDIPTIRPHVLAMTSISRQVMTLVFITCSDGIVGVGEGTTIGGLSYGEESPEGMKLAIDLYCAPLLIGQDALRPNAAMALVRQHVVGNRFAKNALETALLDAMARRAGLPLSELLGSRVRNALPVLWTLASGDTARDIEEAQEMISARRHNVFKLKVGKRSLTEDVKHAAAIKRALGDDISVRVDVNQGWDEHTASRGVRMLAEVGIDLVEQPLPLGNQDGLRRLTHNSPVAIMADEVLRGPGDALAVARVGGAHAFSVKPAQAGGLFAAGRIAAIAAAGHIGVYGGTMLEGSIGTMASAQLFATFDQLEWGTELFGPLLQTEAILADPLEYRDFSLALPDGPGLGLTLDMEKIRRFVREGSGSPPRSYPNMEIS